MTPDVLMTNVEVDGRLVDVRVTDGFVTEVGPRLAPGAVRVVEGNGGALLPGLHDHHVHLNAMAAVHRSVQVGPPLVRSPSELADALATAPSTAGWIRAVGYHEDVAGELDRDRLDAWVLDRPVRVQHRSGALWMLNSAALDQVAECLDDSADVERDDAGRPNGRLWRYDSRLVTTLPDEQAVQRAALRAVATTLLDLGITGVTDATPDLEPEGMALLEEIRPVRVQLLGAPDVANMPPGMTVGPRKLLLHDHDLPDYEQLCAAVDPTGLGPRRRPVAVHCVSRESLVLTLVVLEAVGVVPGDRVEHAAVVPPPVEEMLARLDLLVVTQPDFLRTRGDAYLRDVDADDRPHLYRWRGLTEAGVAVVASSDAPFGDVDPWQVIRSAHERTTEAGVVLGAHEHDTTARALRGYLTTLEAPGGAVRQVRAGSRADLCLLTVGIDQALQAPSADLVRLTLVDGAPAGSRGWPGGL